MSNEQARLACALPESIGMGGMSWSYRGWVGRVYAEGTPEKLLAAHGLSAYAAHPLLRIVEIDRTYYEPLPASAFAEYAAQVPAAFRFLVKAHEDCTVPRFPMHARYGTRRGLASPSYLDPDYAARAVVEPAVLGLREKLGGIVFQFPPLALGPADVFVPALHGFLRRLPRGVTYAVELRSAELVTPEYGAALADAGAVHCHNAWSSMPGILAQARRLPPAARRPLIVRWLLRRGDRYEDAEARYAPFDRMVDEDLEAREEIASLVARGNRHGVPAFVLVDNKAEGCAPESILELTRAVVEKLKREAPR